MSRWRTKRRDLLWIAVIWTVALLFVATVATFFADDDPMTNDALGAVILAAVLGAIATGLYVWARRNSLNRRDCLWIAGIWIPLIGALFVLDTDDPGGAGEVVGFVGGALTFGYLELRRRIRRPKAEPEAPSALRRCPQCGSRMRPTAATCPRCEARSTPWSLHDGVWWVFEAGEWHVLDEKAGYFRRYRDGKPTDPAELDSFPAGEPDA